MKTPKRVRLMMEENVNTSVDGLQSVRRKLFADENDSDGEEQNFCNRIIEENRQRSEEAMKKWNFDFKRGLPLPGRYIWVKLDEYGNEISDSTVNEEQNRNEQTERTEKTERNARIDDEPMDEIAKKKTKLETS